MNYVKQNEWTEVLNSSGAKGNLILTDKNIEMVHLFLEPGAEIGLHALPVDVYFFVIKGNPSFITEEKLTKCCKNDVIFIPAEKMRSWKNSGKVKSEILVTKKKEIK